MPVDCILKGTCAPFGGGPPAPPCPHDKCLTPGAGTSPAFGGNGGSAGQNGANGCYSGGGFYPPGNDWGGPGRGGQGVTWDYFSAGRGPGSSCNSDSGVNIPSPKNFNGPCGGTPVLQPACPVFPV